MPVRASRLGPLDARRRGSRPILPQWPCPSCIRLKLGSQDLGKGRIREEALRKGVRCCDRGARLTAR
jgi:hypothetical protein